MAGYSVADPAKASAPTVSCRSSSLGDYDVTSTFLNISVFSVGGEQLHMPKVDKLMRGTQLEAMARERCRLPDDVMGFVLLLFGGKRLQPHRTLEDQGLKEGSTLVCFIQDVSCLEAGVAIRSVLSGEDTVSAEVYDWWEGIRDLTWTGPPQLSLEKVQLPCNLQSLAFDDTFDQSLDAVQLPGTLRTLTFGYRFDRSLQNVRLPRQLQNLTLGEVFNQDLKEVKLPDGLQSLVLGNRFNRSLQGMQLPKSLQSLSLGDSFDQDLQGVRFPDGLELLTFGHCFNQRGVPRVLMWALFMQVVLLFFRV
eukprot:TRINITY_DN25565_c0_g1_i5.p1 TRINITY_DN25565_c0_g1~~TRINITY_DN25565_c0_g1_i5.p1  ORF type:complete len:328 (+),score=51.59 TRINITY_DN25565_c0_g1_i5:65-985(+)